MKQRCTTARSKFTRKLNVLDKHLEKDDSTETLPMMYSEVEKACTESENKNEAFFDSGDEEIDAGNKAMDSACRHRCSAYEKLTRRSDKPAISMLIC